MFGGCSLSMESPPSVPGRSWSGRQIYIPTGPRACGLEGEPQTGGEDLAAGGAESTSQATQKRPAVAERRVLRSASAGDEKPRVGLRLRPDQDPGRAAGAAVDRHRRIRQGVPGHPGWTQHPVLGCDWDPRRADDRQGCAGAHPLREWARNSPLRPSESGWGKWEPGPCILSLGLRGKMDTWRASTAS